MKATNKRLLWSILWIIVIPVKQIIAQQDSIVRLDPTIDNWENHLEESEAMEDLTEDLLERLEEFRDNGRPNLNDLNYETAINQLKLTDYQYYQLQLYIETSGPLYSIYEIPSIDGFSDEEMRRLADRTVILPPPKPRPTFRELMRSCKNVLWVRYGQVVERQAGYDTSRANHYDGSPAHLQLRYDFSVRQQFGFRIAGEKDAGEQFFRGKQRHGFDHYSGSVFVKNLKWLKYAVLGDYRLNFGQGLVLGSSMLSVKGGGVATLRRFNEGIRAVATTNEGEIFRGGAFTVGNTHWSGSGFAGAVTETNLTAFGGALFHRQTRFTIGGQIICFGQYSDTATAREKWRSLGQPEQWNASVSYHALAGKTLLFGEIAFNERGRPAVLQAALIPIAPVFQMAALVRYYATGYQSPMGSGFRTSSGDCGEFGTYLTGHLILGRNVEADLYCDYYRLRWLSYLTDAPVSGMDAGVSLTCQLPGWNMLYARYQWRTKPKNESDDSYMRRLKEQSRHRLRLQWACKPLSWLDTKTEVSLVINKGSNIEKRWYKGILMYQDLTFSLRKPQLSVYLRVAYFDTDRYDERLYAYENDVYYAFTVGSYYYQGIKGCLLLRYKIRNFSIWFRVARTHYLNKTDISSGLAYIDKPHKTEVKVQGMYRF